MADHASGLLLHPSVGEMIDEIVVIHGHAIRFATVDLSATTGEIRNQLLRVIQPVAGLTGMEGDMEKTFSQRAGRIRRELLGVERLEPKAEGEEASAHSLNARQRKIGLAAAELNALEQDVCTEDDGQVYEELRKMLKERTSNYCVEIL